jgi:hypothetical protein
MLRKRHEISINVLCSYTRYCLIAGMKELWESLYTAVRSSFHNNKLSIQCYYQLIHIDMIGFLLPCNLYRHLKYTCWSPDANLVESRGVKGTWHSALLFCQSIKDISYHKEHALLLARTELDRDLKVERCCRDQIYIHVDETNQRLGSAGNEFEWMKLINPSTIVVISTLHEVRNITTSQKTTAFLVPA